MSALIFQYFILTSPGNRLTAPLLRDIVFPKRFGKAEEFAEFCLHLIENSYLNGEVFRITGGSRMSRLGKLWLAKVWLTASAGGNTGTKFHSLIDVPQQVSQYISYAINDWKKPTTHGLVTGTVYF
jgi:hypothetical protein